MAVDLFAAVSRQAIKGIEETLLYSAIPVAAMVIGGTLAIFRPFSGRLRSNVQHFAAGLVFAAVAVEVLPDLMHYHAPAWAAAGFAIGAATMLLIRWLTESRDSGR